MNFNTEPVSGKFKVAKKKKPPAPQCDKNLTESVPEKFELIITNSTDHLRKHEKVGSKKVKARKKEKILMDKSTETQKKATADEQLRKTEVEILYRLQHLKRRLKHSEKPFEYPNTSNKSCEAIALSNTAVQTCNNTESDSLEAKVDQLNLKLNELNKILSCNQLNVHSDNNENLRLEFTKSIEHLEMRMDKLIESLQSKRAGYMRLSDFAFSEFGSIDRIKNIEQLLLPSADKFRREDRKLQSVLIVNDPICPQVKM